MVTGPKFGHGPASLGSRPGSLVAESLIQAALSGVRAVPLPVFTPLYRYFPILYCVTHHSATIACPLSPIAQLSPTRYFLNRTRTSTSSPAFKFDVAPRARPRGFAPSRPPRRAPPPGNPPPRPSPRRPADPPPRLASTLPPDYAPSSPLSTLPPRAISPASLAAPPRGAPLGPLRRQDPRPASLVSSPHRENRSADSPPDLRRLARRGPSRITHPPRLSIPTPHQTTASDIWISQPPSSAT